MARIIDVIKVPQLLMSAKQCRYPCFGPLWTQQTTGIVFRISFQSDWQIDNGFFNRPIMTHTQILVHRWGPREQGFRRCLTDGLNQNLVLCVAHVSCTMDC